MVKARSIATFLLTNLSSRPGRSQKPDSHYTEWGALTREGLSNLV